MKQYRKTNHGQSLSEYSLAIALVAVAAITGLMAVTGALGGQLGFFSGTLSGGQGSGPGQDIVVNGTLVGTIDAATPGNVPNTSTVQFQLSNGTSVSLPNYPTDIASSVETLGTNGTLNLMLANIDAMITQLEDAGSLDKDKINNLKALSAQGHKMADIERTIEDVYNNSSSLDAFISTQLNYNGTDISIVDLGQQLGWGGMRPSHGMLELDLFGSSKPVYVDETNGLERTLNANPETQAFIDLYNQAIDNGALEDPMLKDIVTTLAKEVAVLSGTTQDITMDLTCLLDTSNPHCYDETGQFVIPTQSHDTFLKDYFISDATHLNSHGICQAGAPNKPGVACQ